MHLIANSSAGQQRLTVKLHPVELGEVTFRLSSKPGGHQKLEISVQRPETLRLLLADSAALHQALDNAGVPPESRSIRLVAPQDASRADLVATPDPGPALAPPAPQDAAHSGDPNPRRREDDVPWNHGPPATEPLSIDDATAPQSTTTTPWRTLNIVA
ncbi:flagellar hook-length control protein FliK [Limobrevibacterium gyesilva]|uniref:Flagellar hook-length control protein FliK n=1 Tax=Limobrevibacterium gyesilva TaxID=2991712 RepID=A0AA42CFS0_9PROT|nr:flagellar hook-length control protein FliK [Limobrevibacterium gyesilva]